MITEIIIDLTSDGIAANICNQGRRRLLSGMNPGSSTSDNLHGMRLGDGGGVSTWIGAALKTLDFIGSRSFLGDSSTVVPIPKSLDLVSSVRYTLRRGSGEQIGL